MNDLLKSAEEYINTNELEIAEKLFLEGMTYENWRNKFGPQL